MAAKGGAIVWSGRILSLLVSLMFVMSATMKFLGGPDLKKGMDHMGLSESLAVPLGILEITCVVIYAIPKTSILGAILLTGYLGGAICTHLRVGDDYVVHIILGIIIWLGVYLRDERLRLLIPIRR